MTSTRAGSVQAPQSTRLLRVRQRLVDLLLDGLELEVEPGGAPRVGQVVHPDDPAIRRLDEVAPEVVAGRRHQRLGPGIRLVQVEGGQHGGARGIAAAGHDEQAIAVVHAQDVQDAVLARDLVVARHLAQERPLVDAGIGAPEDALQVLLVREGDPRIATGIRDPLPRMSRQVASADHLGPAGVAVHAQQLSTDQRVVGGVEAALLDHHVQAAVEQRGMEPVVRIHRVVAGTHSRSLC